MKTLVLAFTLTLAASAAWSQPMPAPRAGQSGNQAATVSPATQDFVSKVAVSDMFEIESSKMAQQKTRNSSIADFAKMMVSDHGKTSRQLMSLTGGLKGVEVPKAMDAEHKQKLDQLKKAAANQFDAQYKAAQIEGHEKAVALFESYSQSGDAAEIKKFAQDTLPKLREHLQHAQQLQTDPASTVGSGAGRPKQEPQRR
jgi:putative membrane protein